MNAANFSTNLGAEVKDFLPQKYIKNNKPYLMDIVSQYTTSAANIAIEDSCLKEREKHKAGVIIGTTLGPISFILDQQNVLKNKGEKAIHKYTAYMALCNALSGDVSNETGATGLSETISSACVSGLSAVMRGAQCIRNEGYDVMIVGGADSAFRPLPYAGLNSIGVLTGDKLRPFDVHANGTVLGEGAAVLILESLEHAKKRKSKKYCEILNGMFTAEAYGHFKHEEKPVQTTRAVSEAIRRSGVKKETIDLVITHGLGIKGADHHEALTYKEYFGEKQCKSTAFTSIKPYIGHPLAAASVFQIVYAIMMIQNEIILPTLNFQQGSKDVKMNIVKEVSLSRKIRNCLIFSMAFGGKCGGCVITRI